MNKQNHFLSVLKNHKGILYKITRNYCANACERKDLEQDIIIALWENFNSYNSDYAYSTWIYTIAVRVAIGSYRKKKQNDEYLKTIDNNSFAFQDSKPDEEDPKLIVLRGFIQELNPINKALIILHLESKAHSEIAEILNISVSNVSTRMLRVKKQLSEKFKNRKK